MEVTVQDSVGRGGVGRVRVITCRRGSIHYEFGDAFLGGRIILYVLTTCHCHIPCILIW